MSQQPTLFDDVPQPKPTYAQRNAKRRKLTKLVAKLGPEATAYDIRKQAEKDGLAPVTTTALCEIRNEIWPNRLRRCGDVNRSRTPTVMVAPSTTGMAHCPNCCSQRTNNRGSYTRKNGTRLERRMCHACGFRFSVARENADPVPHPRRLVAMAATEKYCSGCKQKLPVSDFGKKAGDADLYRSRCKKCLNEQRAAFYFRHRDRVRFPNGHPGAKARREAVPNVSPKEYAALEAAQNGKCAICGTPDKGKRIKYWCTDHSHETGLVRGLLCNKCNLGLGNFNDNLERLEAAVAYLRRNLISSAKPDCAAAGEKDTTCG